MEELKSCPFCGGEAWEYVANNGLVCACHKCEAKILRVFVPQCDWYQQAINCRKAWNTRVKDN